jgi:branched-chain amino acid aminotransferase
VEEISGWEDLQSWRNPQDVAVRVAWCNGEWRDQTAMISTRDRGLCHGLGLFETMLAVDGRAMFLDRHLARLEAGCERLGWPIPTVDFHETIAKLLVQNRLTVGRARVRLAVTAGSGPLDELAAGKDRLVWLVATPLPAAPRAIAVGLSRWPRNEHSPLVGLKCASYGENLMALDDARRRGFSEAIFLNSSGYLCEAATANVFLVIDGVLHTPSLATGCLPGVSRAVILELAAAAGVRCVESLLPATMLDAASEIFLTSATRGPVPLNRLEQRVLPLPILTSRLCEIWEHEILRGRF